MAQSDSSSGENTIDHSQYGLTEDDDDAMNGSGDDGSSVDDGRSVNGEGSMDNDSSDFSDREDISDHEHDPSELKFELTLVKREFEVRYWWEALEGFETDFTFNYIRDTRHPWCSKRNTHCFKLPQDLPDDATDAQKEEAHDTLSKDFTAVIASRMFEFYSTPLEQPAVFWNGPYIALRSDRQRFLEELWQRPPVLYGNALEIASKAPPFDDMTVFTTDNMPVMKKQDFFTQLDDDLRDQVQLTDMQYNVLARFYQVEGLPAGPMSSGELILLYSAWPRHYAPVLLDVCLPKKEYGR